ISFATVSGVAATRFSAEFDSATTPITEGASAASRTSVSGDISGISSRLEAIRVSFDSVVNEPVPRTGPDVHVCGPYRFGFRTPGHTGSRALQSTADCSE